MEAVGLTAAKLDEAKIKHWQARLMSAVIEDEKRGGRRQFDETWAIIKAEYKTATAEPEQ